MTATKQIEQTPAEAKQSRKDKLRKMKSDAQSAPTRTKAIAIAKHLVSMCETYSDCAILQREGWMREVMPDGMTPSDRINDRTRQHLCNVIMSVWAGKFRSEAINSVISEAVSSLRRKLRESGHSIGCNEIAAKVMIYHNLGIGDMETPAVERAALSARKLDIESEEARFYEELDRGYQQDR